MFSDILILDNDTRYATQIKKTLEKKLEINCDIINDFSEVQIVEDISGYGLYFIRLHQSNYKLIDKLDDDDKKIVLLTNRDDAKTREKIQSFGVTDYIFTNNTSKGDIAFKITDRLIKNSKLNVLLVDDSTLILNTLSILLDTQSLNTIKCSSGKKALEYLSSNPNSIDLVIVDYEMPNMNGYELIKIIRKDYPLYKLPILILSGTEESFIIAKFLKAGANDYIPKPFINEAFINRISNTLTASEIMKAK